MGAVSIPLPGIVAGGQSIVLPATVAGTVSIPLPAILAGTNPVVSPGGYLRADELAYMRWAQGLDHLHVDDLAFMVLAQDLDHLFPDEVGYMRATQAEHRPTAAVWTKRTVTNDGYGGQDIAWTDPLPVDVLIHGPLDQVPQDVADRLEGGTVHKIVMDLVDVRANDRITVSGSEVYQVVSSRDPDRWTTAQVVLAVRLNSPVRA
jgi:hypothetical protein